MLIGLMMREILVISSFITLAVTFFFLQFTLHITMADSLARQRHCIPGPHARSILQVCAPVKERNHYSREHVQGANGSMSLQPLVNSTPVNSTPVNSTHGQLTLVNSTPGQFKPVQLNQG